MIEVVNLNCMVPSVTESSLLFSFSDIKTTVIHPATEKHIAKYTAQEMFLVTETGEDYSQITLPYIEGSTFSVKVRHVPKRGPLWCITNHQVGNACIWKPYNEESLNLCYQIFLGVLHFLMWKKYVLYLIYTLYRTPKGLSSLVIYPFLLKHHL